MPPESLAQVLGRLPRRSDPRVLVATETSDDAGVIRLPAGAEALVATVDFITPPCDDAATFGRIAAANAVSDVYAMGAEPLAALSIACHPRAWPIEVLGDVMAGGASALASIDVPVLGGHTVEDPEMKFGYAVFGTGAERRLWRNATAAPGDRLLLTKPLGTGILGAAARAGDAVGTAWDAALASMQSMNAAAARAVDPASVHAATDVTGFGLVGHAAQMARSSGVTLRIEAASVPLLPDVLTWRARGRRTRAEASNLRHAQPMRVHAGVREGLLAVLADAQTSGGLLLAVADDAQLPRLVAAGCPAVEIGRVEPASDACLVIA